MPLKLFALERYDTGGDVPVPRPDLPLTGVSQLISLAQLPDDDVLLAMVEGPDADTVTAAMAAAGWRVDRITPANWVCAPSAPRSAEHPAAQTHSSDPEVLR